MDRRVRTGCLTCLRRRVKCDEAKPLCSRCSTGNFICEGYRPPRRALPQAGSSSQSLSLREEQGPSRELSWKHPHWRQEQLPLYHHFVTATAVRLFRKDHVGFWRDQVAQISVGSDLVYQALLSVGAIHRGLLLRCQDGSVEEASRSKVLGLKAYGVTLRLLSNYLNQEKKLDMPVLLIVLILLTYFECFQENPKGALRHLWAAIQFLPESEDTFSISNPHNMVPLCDAMLELDILAQKLVPYASSSFSRFSKLTTREVDFGNRLSLQHPGNSLQALVVAERHRLIQLVCGHNKSSRVIWGSWYPTSDRPSRDKLIDFLVEIRQWRANSPATFECSDMVELFDPIPLDMRPLPPIACRLSTGEMALNMLMYNTFVGCSLAMIATTDVDPAPRELESMNLVYQSLCIIAGLVESSNGQSENRDKPCDAISMGISVYIYQIARRCFSQAWQQWIIATLRLIGPEGLSNGFTSANTLEIMFQLEAKLRLHTTEKHNNIEYSPLGCIRNRLIPLLLPPGSDGQQLAFYLRYGNEEVDSGERAIKVVAKATWKQDTLGKMDSPQLDVYEAGISGYEVLPDRPQALALFHSWRSEVDKGWHGYLPKDIQDGFLGMEEVSHAA
ncbi:hypothetical protein V494_07355 [Pseudogymnoascus sp. VKM F-4513 (FW-928)]|nr:hypothetical protein V494_07355 [Pseudogymnoascus sp. VKM F-4513 (FW-928)]